MPRYEFTTGQVLTADQMNDLSDQTVMVFAGTAARGSAIPSPTEGMVTYRSDDDVVEVFDGSSFVGVGGGKILQVVSTTKTDTFSTSSSTFNDLTGLSLSITPSSASNKILVSYFFESSASETANQFMSRLMRDSTPIAIGDTASNRTPTTTGMRAASTIYTMQPSSAEFLDSPNTTSSVTYKVQVRCSANGQTAFVSRTIDDSDTANYSRGIATITAVEVAG